MNVDELIRELNAHALDTPVRVLTEMGEVMDIVNVEVDENGVWISTTDAGEED